mgnify:CR=1 FL=1
MGFPVPLSSNLELMLGYKRISYQFKLDPQIFPICVTRREEFKKGFRKRIVYFVHKLPDCTWDIVRLSSEGIKCYRIPPKPATSSETHSVT